MIEEAEKEGRISPQKKTIVEITSGNTGKWCAAANGIGALSSCQVTLFRVVSKKNLKCSVSVVIVK
jgi:cysteine synthase